MNGEAPQVYRHATRVARKPHVCCECRGNIHTGERYNYHSGVWGGRGASYKVCADCEELREEMDLGALDDSERTPFGYVYDHLYEMDEADHLIARFEQTKTRRKAPCQTL
jgi:hypothetical protein